MSALNIGLTVSGKPFTLPLDAVVQTCAILAIRGAGKTCTAAVIAEEMCKAQLPWICFDPVGVWWGLRANTEGKPSGFPVVVIGGEHGDIPLEKTGGAKIAEALASENVFAVIDVSMESKHTWRQFLTEFCLALMQFNPETPRHLFIEEAPEFVPQRTKVSLTAQCKEAVERLVRLGRNRGYGCTLISQRPATVDKDVLSQCENLLVLRTTGPHDRQALQEWIEAKATARGLDKFVSELAGLPNGHAWFWSPHWLNVFERIRIRERLTFHPGATRTMGIAPKAVALADVGQFVDRLRRQLTKHRVAAPRVEQQPEFRRYRQARSGPLLEIDDSPGQLAELESLRSQLAQERTARSDAERRLATVREVLRPQYESLKGLFEQLGGGATGAVNRSAFEPWLAKAGRAGCRRLLETLIERPQLTRPQLGTLGGVSHKSSTFRAYIAWLNRNGLIETNGDTITLRQL
jgi:Helicase HerA, central domain